MVSPPYNAAGASPALRDKVIISRQNIFISIVGTDVLGCPMVVSGKFKYSILNRILSFVTYK